MYFSSVILAIVTVKFIIVNGNIGKESIEVLMKNETTLEIKWNKFGEILDNTSYIVTVNSMKFETSDTFLNLKTTQEDLCEIYRISVCYSQTCANTTFDSSIANELVIGRVTNVSTITRNNITTISWNPPGDGSKCVLTYFVELRQNKKRILGGSVNLTKIEYINLEPCQEYEVHLQPIAKQKKKSVNKIFRFKIKPQEPKQPTKPSLISRSSTTLTITSEYNTVNDKCRREKFIFTCSSDDVHLSRTSKLKHAIFTNLKPMTLYSCNVSVMNSVGWSMESVNATFKTDLSFDKIVELTAEQLNSTSISVKWLSTSLSLTVDKALINITNANHNVSNPFNRLIPVQWHNTTEIITLEPDTSYTIQMIVYLSHEIIEYTNMITITIASANRLPIIGISIFICCAFIAIPTIFVIIFFARKRQTGNACQHDRTNNIEVKNFRTFYLRNGLRLMFDEFSTLKQMNPGDGLKNYDQNRVPLAHIKLDSGQDYINASYINGYNRKQKFIATQSPTNKTVYDFWRMIQEKKCTAIVMITNSYETSFYQYYPSLNKTYTFNDLTITTVKDKQMENFNKRKLTIKKGNKIQIVKQYHFKKWSESGCLVNDIELLKFIQFIKAKNIRKPMVVHCNNGAGRTGTYIALDILIDQVQHATHINVLETVRQLRAQRPKMVETVEQYLFLYSTIDHYLKNT